MARTHSILPVAAKRLTALVVEDERQDQKIIRDTIACIPGFVILGAVDSALGAVTLAQIQRPDLITLDLGLPDFQGLQALKLIKSASREARIFVLSSAIHESIVTRCLQCGANAVFDKVTDFPAFTAALHELALAQ